jgi:hypothetical protein
LQGPLTDKSASQRLRQSIENAEETVELLLNYNKSGEPFWNLLYVSPLFDPQGKVAFFLGGQVDCSTTIHSCTDILRILSLNDEGISDKTEDFDSQNHHDPQSNDRPLSDNRASYIQSRSSFFKSFRSNESLEVNKNVLPMTGMESGLMNKLGKLSLRTQAEALYTAYSKVRTQYLTGESDEILF